MQKSAFCAMLTLLIVTAFFVLGIVGTVGKLLFDDWRVRQAMRSAAHLKP